MIFEMRSPEATFALGEKLGRQARPGDIIALSGDLGAGKTVFTKGFASGIGITDPVTSPTFTILQVYEGGRLPMYHFDVYRLGEPEEMDEIGYEEYFFGNGVSLVEWADLFPELMPPETIHVTIQKDLQQGENYRKIEITPCDFSVKTLQMQS